jgi:uncharacterized membrane protein
MPWRNVVINITAMKKLLLSLLAVAAVTVTVAAQDKVAPRTEYSVSLSENKIQVKPGESKEITVSILRSKSFSRSEAKLGLSSGLPEGVTVTYAPAEGMFDSTVATITVAPDAKEGEYQVILKATLNNKTKGSIVKLVVGSGSTTPKDALTAN